MTRRGRQLLLAGAGALALGAGGAVLWRAQTARTARLPERVRVDEVLEDLVTSFAPAAVIDARSDAPVHVGGLQPSPYLDGRGSHRRALVTPPPALMRWRRRLPAAAELRLAVGVARDERQGRDAAGVRFVARVAGREVFSRLVNPARSRHERRWFEARVDLGRLAGQEVDIELETRAEGTGPLAGTPGWSTLGITREHSRARQGAGPDTPNLLVLLVDTLRADRLGCYGARPSPSPTLDALARRGLLFEHAVAQAPWTMPSVATILTGLHPRQHGVVGGSWQWGRPPGVDADADWAFLRDDVPTLAEEALRAGITTFGVSTNSTVSPGTGIARGFETFVKLEGDPPAVPWATAADVNQAFLAWAGANRDRRFLAYLHYMDVHGPYVPPAEFRPPPPPDLRRAIRDGQVHRFKQQARGGGPPLPDREVAYLLALYDAEIRYWDAQLAVLLERLDALGLLASTNVLVTSDHGEEFQEHGRLGHGSQLYDELVRVPLVLAGPSVRSARVAEQAQGIDVVPTAAALLGLPRRAGLPGTDLRGPLDARPAVSETRFGIAPDGTNVELLAVRTPGAKLIRTPALARAEFYDLARDPHERESRRDQTADATALAAALERWQAATPAAPPATGGDPRLFEKLRALGYVE